jgi:hypothetical protein
MNYFNLFFHYVVKLSFTAIVISVRKHIVVYIVKTTSVVQVVFCSLTLINILTIHKQMIDISQQLIFVLSLLKLFQIRNLCLSSFIIYVQPLLLLRI